MLVGSGTVLLVICPWTVVIPLFEAGGTRFSGLLVIEYVTPPMVTAVVVKLTTPVPELEALNDPLKVAEKLSLPAIGTLWVIVRVKVPDAAMVPLPDTKVWKFPKLDPVGVFKLVDPRPVNVIIKALPLPPKNVTELVPLPEHPAHVKTPDVEKVTGAAFVSVVANVAIATSNALIIVALKKRVMFLTSSSCRRMRVRPLRGGTHNFVAYCTRVNDVIVSTATGQMPLASDEKLPLKVTAH